MAFAPKAAYAFANAAGKEPIALKLTTMLYNVYPIVQDTVDSILIHRPVLVMTGGQGMIAPKVRR